MIKYSNHSEKTKLKMCKSQRKRFDKNPISQETKEKMRKNNLGKKLSKESKLKVSIARKGKATWNKGKKTGPQTKEHRMKIGIGNKGKTQTEESKEKMRISTINSKKFFKDTSIEIAMQDLLLKNGVKFEKQKPLINKYRVDLFVKPDLVIECDGDYWHNRPGSKEKDKIRDKNLKECGYKVLRFWQHEINNNLDGCWKIIKQEIYV